MTPEQRECVLAVFAGILDDKTIQRKSINGWDDVSVLNVHDLKSNPDSFRIKPETVRVWEWKAHGPNVDPVFVWASERPESIEANGWLTRFCMTDRFHDIAPDESEIKTEGEG